MQTTEIPTHAWVDNATALAELAREAAQAPWLAIDTEACSMHAYRDRLCLLQINYGGKLALIDLLALAGGEPSPALDPLRPLLEDPARCKILHGGEYDCGALRRDYGLQLRGVWDGQQAAALLGWERSGYAAVVERCLGVKLEKAFTEYDWRSRPIDPGARSYALEDVIHLPGVRAHIEAELDKADIREEFTIACTAVEDTGWHGGYDPAGFWKIKGSRDLDPSSRAVLAALWTWRDGIAKRVDRPAGRVLNNELMLALARRSPTSFQQLKHVGVRGRVLESDGESLIETIRLARSNPPEVPPFPRDREVEADEEDRETRMKDWRRAEAAKRATTLQVVLPAKALEYLKRHGAGDLDVVPQLGPKRIRTYGDKLRQLCSHRSAASG